MSIATHAIYECEPGDRDAVLRVLAPARAATEQEEGCLYFHTLLPESSPDRIVLIEGWRSAEDLRRHRETEHFITIVLGAVAPRVRHRTVEVCSALATAPVAAGTE